MPPLTEFAKKAFIGSMANKTSAKEILAAINGGFSGSSAPADSEISNGQAFLYWDFSGSDVVLKFKGKADDGTVISKTVTAS